MKFHFPLGRSSIVKQDNNKFTCETQIFMCVLHMYTGNLITVPIPVTARYKPLIWRHLMAGIVSSNLTERMEVRPTCLLCVV